MRDIYQRLCLTNSSVYPSDISLINNNATIIINKLTGKIVDIIEHKLEIDGGLSKEQDGTLSSSSLEGISITDYGDDVIMAGIIDVKAHFCEPGVATIPSLFEEFDGDDDHADEHIVGSTTTTTAATTAKTNTSNRSSYNNKKESHSSSSNSSSNNNSVNFDVDNEVEVDSSFSSGTSPSSKNSKKNNIKIECWEGI